MLLQAKKIKYLWVLSRDTFSCGINSNAGVVPDCFLKSKPSQRAKLLFYQSSYIPTFTYVHELLKVKKRFRIQAAEISILYRVAGAAFKIGVELRLLQKLRIMLLLLFHIERSQLKWFRDDIMLDLFALPFGGFVGTREETLG